MTRSQADYIIGNVLHHLDFTEWDISHQLAELADEYNDGEIDDDALSAEVECLLNDANFGDVISEKVTEGLVMVMKNESE